MFNSDFVWGAATASYQVEGSFEKDGRGPCVWDWFCKQPGKVLNGDSGQTACAHYLNFKEDVRLMKEMGLQSYRFSISWPRILPNGTGEINETGLRFYDALVDALLAADIVPIVTLYHWDMPQALHLKGGWLNPDMPDYFEQYTRIVVARLSDRVKQWITFNEPNIFVNLGYSTGLHAPGYRLTRNEVLVAYKNVLLAHGKSVLAIRQLTDSGTLVGFAPAAAGMVIPATDNPAEITPVLNQNFDLDHVPANELVMHMGWWTEPILAGRLPNGYAETCARLVAFSSDELALIHQPTDFIGLNVYSATWARMHADNQFERLPFSPGYPQTSFGWYVVPEAMYWATKMVWDRYHIPIKITENGLSNSDWVNAAGDVSDPQRIQFLQSYLQQLARAISEGVHVNAYYHWSLMDNFEWAEGYKQRFGLIHVDFATQKRTLKQSAHWYASVIQSNGANLGNPASALRA